MAQFYLINTVMLGRNKLFPGMLIDDAQYVTTDITNAGGLLWPAADAVVATAALQAQSGHKNGMSEADLGAIMTAAVESVQKTNDALTNAFAGGAVGIVANVTRTQAGATPLTKRTSRVDTSTSPAAGSTVGDGVVLPASAVGECIVINNTANTIQLYGAGTDTINGQPSATGVPLAPGDVAFLSCAAAGAWFFDAGMGASGPLPVELACDAITAAGSTQAAATQLVAALNRVVTATAGQGVKLPASAAGLDVWVDNHTGTNIQVYGAGTDTIDDVPFATGLYQMDSSVVVFTCPGRSR